MHCRGITIDQNALSLTYSLLIIPRTETINVREFLGIQKQDDVCRPLRVSNDVFQIDPLQVSDVVVLLVAVDVSDKDLTAYIVESELSVAAQTRDNLSEHS